MKFQDPLSLLVPCLLSGSLIAAGWDSAVNVRSQQRKVAEVAVISAGATAGLCQIGEVTLTSQAEVDSFQADYGPNCTEIEGILVISGADIVNVDGLAGINVIHGGLSLFQNPNLIDLSGVGSLTSVTELEIIDNPALSTIDGLSNLELVEQNLYIERNDTLQSLDGLSSLERIPELGYLSIGQNIALTSLDGLSALTELGGTLAIAWNTQLGSVSGLSGVSSLGGSLILTGNTALVSLGGLHNIVSINGSLAIASHPGLTHLDDLSGLSGPVAGLEVSENLHLQNLDGLAGISQATHIAILDNPELQDLNGLANLTGSDPVINIVNNDQLIQIDALSGISRLGASYNVFLCGGYCESLYVAGNANLRNLDGLVNLQYALGDIVILDNPHLTPCAPLRKLLDQIDDGVPGPGPGPDGIPDVGGDLLFSQNFMGCNSLQEIFEIVSVDGFE